MFSLETSLRSKTIIYNGVQFGGKLDSFHLAPPDYAMSATPVYDDTGRAVKTRQYMLTVNTVIVTDSQSTSHSDLKELLKRLETPRAQLQINTGAGVDPLTIDYQNGPLPRVLNITPLGGNIAWALQWQVEFASYLCPPNVSVNNPSWESFAYNTTWNLDESGRTIRTISGFWTVPAPPRGAVGAGEPASWTADTKRQYFYVEVPFGFRRSASVYSESADKRRVDFSVVDTEFGDEYPYPHGCVAASGSRNVTGIGPAQVNGAMSLNMSLTVAPGYPRSHGALAFFREAMAMQARYTALMRLGKVEYTILPQNVTVSPKLFDAGRTTDYSFTWLMTGCITDLLLSQGLWEPVATDDGGVDYTRWRQSITGISGDPKYTWHQRGWSQLGTLPQDDVILTTCAPNLPIRVGRTSARRPPDQAGTFTAFGTPEITPERSWLAYDAQVLVHHQEFIRTHRAAVEHEPSTENKDEGWGHIAFSTPSGRRNTRDEWIGEPVQRVMLQFKGLRVSHKPEPPTLQTVGGRAVKPSELVHNTVKQIGSAFGQPIWLMRFAKIYVVTDATPINDMTKTHKQKSLCAISEDPDASEYGL